MVKNRSYVIIFVSLFILSISTSNVISKSNPHVDYVIRRENYVVKFLKESPNIQFFNRMDENDSQSRWRYTMTWSELVEYEDLDNDGVFRSLNDSVVTSIDLTSLFFTLDNGTGDFYGISVIGTQYNFTKSFSQGTGSATMSIAVDWWNQAVDIPYAGETLHINERESKIGLTISDWSFSSSNNRLALLVEISTTTPLEKYAVATYENGSFGMLTKENSDGRGHRGGLFNNPSKYISDGVVGNTKTMLVNKTSSLEFQYNFESFSDKIYYDPTYSAVALPSLPPEYETSNGIGATSSSNTSSSTTGQGIPGYTFEMLLVPIVISILLQKRKK